MIDLNLACNSLFVCYKKSFVESTHLTKKYGFTKTNIL